MVPIELGRPLTKLACQDAALREQSKSALGGVRNLPQKTLYIK